MASKWERVITLRDSGMYGHMGHRMYVGTFTMPYSEAAIDARIAGKRGKWYLEATSPNRTTFAVYDSKKRYRGGFTRGEIFSGRPVRFVRATSTAARRKRKTKRSGRLRFDSWSNPSRWMRW